MKHRVVLFDIKYRRKKTDRCSYIRFEFPVLIGFIFREDHFYVIDIHDVVDYDIRTIVKKG